MIYPKKKRIEKKHIIYKAYIFLPINNDMFSNNIKCKFMSYILVFMIIYLYIYILSSLRKKETLE